MSLNEYIMQFKVVKPDEKRRMIIDYIDLSKLRVAKNYEFSEKLSLPCIINTNTILIIYF